MLSEIALSCKAVDTTLESCDHSKAAVCCRVTVYHAVRDGTKFSGSKQKLLSHDLVWHATRVGFNFPLCRHGNPVFEPQLKVCAL